MKIIIPILLFFFQFSTFTIFAQEPIDSLSSIPIYKRIAIEKPNPIQINTLHEMGVDLICGANYRNEKLELELDEFTIRNLEQEGIDYSIIINDLATFYGRNAELLPAARTELELLKSKPVNLSETTVNNILENDRCEEIDWPVPNNFNLNPNSTPISFGGCLTYSQVLEELDEMRSLYPNLISVKLDASPTNQKTIEDRTIFYVRISDNPDVDEEGEPETLYQSLIHSREPSSLMQLLYYMWYLLENYENDPGIRNLLNNQALYFIPVFNPDGFVYNETVRPDGGGFQRKNRNVSGGCSTFVDGIDLNRNSAYYWGNGGSSTNTCSDIYLGSAPFSENETQIMRDFFLEHDFKLTLNHHSFKNAMLHAYAGVEIDHQRDDEYSKYNHDMTEFNRYAYGPSTSISSLNSGNMNDWMLGGPAGVSANGTPTGTGSGKETMAWTPENGTSDEGGFWPEPGNYVLIAKRAVRMNFLAAFFSGKFGKLIDLNQSEINSTNGSLRFGVENLGQTPSDFQVEINPISDNILSVSDPVVLSNMAILSQEETSFDYTLDPNIFSNDLIQFEVTLSNDYASDNILYTDTLTIRYQSDILFSDDPDTDGLSNWTASGGIWFLTNDAFSGTDAITSTITAPYSNDESKFLALNEPLDFSNVEEVRIEFFGKWDLERSFDYVQLEASINGFTWFPLCGELTKMAAPDINNTYSNKSFDDNFFQPDGAQLYDGDTQDKWNLEQILIDDQNNELLLGANNVFLRFSFQTDSENEQGGYSNADFKGFSFDDFKCIVVNQLNTPVTELSDSNFKVYPNPTADQLSIDLSSTSNFRSISIVDIYGKIIYEHTDLNFSNLDIDTQNWSPGVYFVKVQGVGIEKVVKW